MLTNENGRKTKRLSREILGLLLITAVIALFFWGFLYLTANSISETYFTERNLQPSEGQWLTLRAWIRSVSLLSTVILFLVLFLFLLGQKLAYLREIIQGVDALRTHRLEDTIPLREANELTELAEHINFLSETERRLRQQEMALQAERERMIRDLSHDIRTPLTAILSYSDYMSRKDGYTDAELREYFSLVRKKAAQMKDMTDRLLEGSKRNVEPVENGMQLMDVAKRTWSDEILEGLGIEKRLLGKMYESQDVTGEVHQEAAALTGLAAGTIVVGGAGDNPAAAIGTGIVSQGKAFTTIGTSAVVYAVSDRMVLDPKGRVHTLCASVPGKWTVMSCTQAAGLSLQWLRNHVCTPEMAEAAEKGVDPYEIMTAEAARVPIGSEKLIYLPYLMGERSPHPDPDCRGVFFGLSAMHERPHLIRSVMEGISFSQWECVEVFREMGVPIEDMMICGGGGRSPFWRQMLADMYGCSVSTVQSDQGGALGAAILAGVGAGIYSDLETACDALVRKKDSSEPNMAANGAYAKYFTLYKELYRTLFQSFKDLKNI